MCITKEIKLGCGDADDMVFFIEHLKYGTTSPLRVLILRLYHKNLAAIITSAKTDWSVTKKPKFLAIMRSYANLGNFVLYTQLISICFVVLLYIIGNLPFLQPGVQSNSTNNIDDILFERTLPLRTNCLFKDVSITKYVFLYILQIIQIILIVLGIIGSDAFFFSLAMHICGQFEALHQEISDFVEGNDFIKTKLRIAALSKRHQHLLEGAQNFQTTFNLIITVQLVINITAMCECGNITFIFTTFLFFYQLNYNKIITQVVLTSLLNIPDRFWLKHGYISVPIGIQVMCFILSGFKRIVELFFYSGDYTPGLILDRLD